MKPSTNVTKSAAELIATINNEPAPRILKPGALDTVFVLLDYLTKQPKPPLTLTVNGESRTCDLNDTADRAILSAISWGLFIAWNPRPDISIDALVNSTWSSLGLNLAGGPDRDMLEVARMLRTIVFNSTSGYAGQGVHLEENDEVRDELAARRETLDKMYEGARSEASAILRDLESATTPEHIRRLRGAAWCFIAQRPATRGSGLDRSVRVQFLVSSLQYVARYASQPLTTGLYRPRIRKEQ